MSIKIKSEKLFVELSSIINRGALKYTEKNLDFGVYLDHYARKNKVDVWMFKCDSNNKWLGEKTGSEFGEKFKTIFGLVKKNSSVDDIKNIVSILSDNYAKITERCVWSWSKIDKNHYEVYILSKKAKFSNLINSDYLFYFKEIIIFELLRDLKEAIYNDLNTNVDSGIVDHILDTLNFDIKTIINKPESTIEEEHIALKYLEEKLLSIREDIYIDYASRIPEHRTIDVGKLKWNADNDLLFLLVHLLKEQHIITNLNNKPVSLDLLAAFLDQNFVILNKKDEKKTLSTSSLKQKLKFNENYTVDGKLRKMYLALNEILKSFKPEL